jgi:hypothetical protein
MTRHGLNWVNPVAGTQEWSAGSWMPNTLTHRGRTHAAIDIYAIAGTPIVAPVSGTVMASASGKIGGNYVRIKGDDGIVYYFAHMQQLSHLQKGQRISKAAIIGRVGTTGSAKNTKSHLHFSMRSNTGAFINPVSYLTDGYKLDAPPGLSYVDAQGEEQQQQPPIAELAFANADEIVAGVIGEDDEQVKPLTASEVLGGALSAASDLVAGGSRLDYRNVGLSDITAEGLRVKAVGETSATEETTRTGPLNRLLGKT